jgi:hypothetical protein
MIEIETGIPIPARKSNGLPFNAIAIGESFFVPVDLLTKSSMSQLAGYGNRNYPPKRFISRQAISDGKKGRRVWRIE